MPDRIATTRWRRDDSLYEHQTITRLEVQMSEATAVNLRDKFELFSEQWTPKLVGELNGQLDDRRVGLQTIYRHAVAALINVPTRCCACCAPNYENECAKKNDRRRYGTETTLTLIPPFCHRRVPFLGSVILRPSTRK